MKTFSSVLAATIRDYLTLKRALGRQYNNEEWTLERLDRFLAAHHADLSAEMFAAWCLTLQNLASGVRRAHMRHVRNLCLYRRRREPGCFVPDERLFPPLHQKVRPHIFTDAQVAQLLAIARTLTRTANSPLCPENMRHRALVHHRAATWRAGTADRGRLQLAGAVTGNRSIQVSQIAPPPAVGRRRP